MWSGIGMPQGTCQESLRLFMYTSEHILFVKHQKILCRSLKLSFLDVINNNYDLNDKSDKYRL